MQKEPTTLLSGSASASEAVSDISKEMEEVYGCVRDLRMIVNILDSRLDENLFPGYTAENFAIGATASDCSPSNFFYFRPIERDMVAFLMFDARERADKLDKLAEDLNNKLVLLAGDMRRGLALKGGAACR